MPVNFHEDRRLIATAVASASLFYLLKNVLDYRSPLRSWIRAWRKPWVQVGTISEILIHPIKSCRGHSIESGWCGPRGLVHNEMIDRHLMIWDLSENKMITARQDPKAVTIKSDISEGVLLLSVLNDEDCTDVNLNEVVRENCTRTVEVWGSTIEAYDCGETASNWVSNVLEHPAGTLRLMYYEPSLASHRGLHQLKNVNQEHHKLFSSMGREDEVAFSDTTPYDLGTQESLDELNSRLHKPLTFRSFRPNFVVKGTPGPFDEDLWDEVKIGENAKFKHVSRCGRCVLTTVDPENATKDKDNQPLKTLRKYRLAPDSERELYGYSPLFCINLGIDSAGDVNVGDPVFVTYKS